MVSLRSHLAGFRRALTLVAWAGLVCGTLADAGTGAITAALAGWFEAQTRLKTWSADFVETRYLQTLTQPLVSTGHVAVSLPDRFRWQLGEPPQTIVIRQPAQLLIVYPRFKRIEKYPLEGKQSGPWRDALSMLEAGFPRGPADLDSRFRTLSITQTNAQLEVTLQPRGALARRMMDSLQLQLRTNDWSLLSMEIHFGDGSWLRDDFANAAANPVLADDLFETRAYADFSVVEPLKK